MQIRLYHIARISLLAVVFGQAQAFAWSEHHAITFAALEGIPELAGLRVKVSSVEEFLAKIGLADPDQFNTRNQWNRRYRFEPRMHEISGDEVRAIDVLATYSDEPDWGMDKDLFEADQYPELWKSEYAFMGGKNGTPSQSFRHMYWQPWLLSHPLATFKLPLGKLFEPMGVAPERAARFMELSRQAHKLGDEYWRLRFLANALHYLEDVTQPFHATQTPSKRYYWMQFFDSEGAGFHGYVTQATHLITYYHWAFEDYIGVLMTDKPLSEEGKKFVLYAADPSLGAKDESTAVSYHDGDIASMVRDLARVSMTEASTADWAAMKFFPPVRVPYLELDVGKYLDSKWWDEVRTIGRSDTEQKKVYFAVVKRMFGTMGDAIRAVVMAETAAQP